MLQWNESAREAYRVLAARLDPHARATATERRALPSKAPHVPKAPNVPAEWPGDMDRGEIDRGEMGRGVFSQRL